MNKLLIFIVFLLATLPLTAMNLKSPQNGFKEFMMAVEQGRVEDVRTLLKTGFNLFEKVNQNGDTVFIIAVRNGHKEVAREILEHAFMQPELLSYSGTYFIDTLAKYPNCAAKAEINKRIFIFLNCINKKLKERKITLPKFIKFEIIKMAFSDAIDILKLLEEENNDSFSACSYVSDYNEEMKALLEKYKSIYNIHNDSWRWCSIF
jgi:hypothetical protein